MLDVGYYYPEQKEASAERIVLFVRRHWFAFMPWLGVVSLMVVSPPVLLFGVFNIDRVAETSLEVRTLTVFMVSAWYLFTLSVFIVGWIDYYLDATIVTEQRLIDIHQNGLFNRRVSEQSLLRVQDVSARVRGLFQTLLHFGTVHVETAGEAPDFMMKNLANPNVVANTIIALHRKLVDEGKYSPAMAEAEGILPSADQRIPRDTRRKGDASSYERAG